MSLTIKVQSALNLRNLESVGKSDPYVTIAFQGKKFEEILYYCNKF